MAICFVSLDRENSSFEGYFKKMPWFAIPRTDPTIRSLTSLFQVNSIPKLVVVGSDGAVLNHNAVQSVSQLGSAGFPWKEEAGAVGSLSYEPLASFAFTIVIVLLVLFLPYLDQIRSKLGI